MYMLDVVFKNFLVAQKWLRKLGRLFVHCRFSLSLTVYAETVGFFVKKRKKKHNAIDRRQKPYRIRQLRLITDSANVLIPTDIYSFPPCVLIYTRDGSAV